MTVNPSLAAGPWVLRKDPAWSLDIPWFLETTTRYGNASTSTPRLAKTWVTELEAQRFADAENLSPAWYPVPQNEQADLLVREKRPFGIVRVQDRPVTRAGVPQQADRCPICGNTGWTNSAGASVHPGAGNCEAPFRCPNDCPDPYETAALFVGEVMTPAEHFSQEQP